MSIRRSALSAGLQLLAVAVFVAVLAAVSAAAVDAELNWARDTFGTPLDLSAPIYNATNVSVTHGPDGMSFIGTGHSWFNIDLRGKTVDSGLYRKVTMDLYADTAVEVEVMAWNSNRQYVTSGRRPVGPGHAALTFDFSAEPNWTAEIIAVRLNVYGTGAYKVDITSFDIVGGKQVVITPASYASVRDLSEPVRIHFVDENLAVDPETLRLYVNGVEYRVTDSVLNYDQTERVLSFDVSSARFGSHEFRLVVDGDKGSVLEESWSLMLQPEEWQDERGYTMSGWRQVVNLDGAWKISKPEVFNRKPTTDAGYAGKYWDPNLDVSSWDSIQVPSLWYAKFPEVMPKVEGSYWYNRNDPPTYVVGWYRRDFTVPETLQGQRLVLRFGAVGYQATVWLNGVELGTHKGKYTPFEFDITEVVDFTQENVLVVRVEDDFGDWPPTHTYGIMWYVNYNIGGIWQSVDIIATPQVYIDDLRLRPELSVVSGLRGVPPHEDRLNLRFSVNNGDRNPARVRMSGVIESVDGTQKQVYDLGEVQVAAGKSVNVDKTVPLKDIKYWSPDSPNLYTVTLVLRDEADEIIEVFTERTGFRDFRVVGTDFYLNGERIYLFGGNLFSAHFVPGLGSSDLESAKERAYERLRMWKESGTVILRTAHMPLQPWVYDMADEMGIMLMNEWGWFHRVFSSFPNQAAEDVFFENNTKEMIEWFARDYNHPSVVIWVINNEAFSTELMNVLTRTYNALRPLDDTGRPISAQSGLHSIPWRERGPVATDLYDQHNYVAWPLAIKAMDEYAERIRTIYGDIMKPLVVWEFLDLDYTYGPPRRLRPDQTLTVEEWLQYIGTGHAAKYSSLIGMKAYMDSELGPGYAVEKYNKRFFEALFQHQDFKGLAPWIRTPITELQLQFYRPLVPMFEPLHQRHLLTGNQVTWSVRVPKKTDAPFRGTVDVNVYDPNGQLVWNTRVGVELGTGFVMSSSDVVWNVPEDMANGLYRVTLLLNGMLGGEPYTAENSYEITVSSHQEIVRPIRTDKRVAVWAERSPAKSAFDVRAVLDGWGVDYTVITSVNELRNFDVLIVPPYRHEAAWIEAGGRSVDADVSTLAYGHASEADREPTVRSVYPELFTSAFEQWVRGGGRLLILPQELSGELPVLSTYSIERNIGNSGFVDAVAAHHPIFDGMDREHWDMWYGHSGVVTSYRVTPAGTHIIGATGGKFTAILEARFGQGSILVTTVDVKDRYLVDGAATRYVQNLFSYVLEQEIDPNIAGFTKLFW